MNRASAWCIPVGSFGLALALSILIGPSTRAQGMRAPAQETGCPCKVTVTCKVNACRYEFDPATLPGATEKDLQDIVDAAVAHCKTDAEFAACFNGFNENNVKSVLGKVLKQIQQGKRKAYTLVTNGAAKVSSKCVNPTGNGGDVTIDLCGVAITLIPKGAPKSLNDHENGHVKIQNHYVCVLLRKLLEVRLTQEICSKKYKDQKELERDAQNLAGKIQREFIAAMGTLNDWEEKYDTDTDDGENGQDQDQEAIKITNAMDALAKQKFPGVFE